MSKHNSYSLKYSAELSATLKENSLIPSGKRIPTAVNQVPHKLNFPNQHKWQADFPFSTKWNVCSEPMCECHWLHLCSGQLPHSHKPHEHTQTRHPEPCCLMSSSLTRFHSIWWAQVSPDFTPEPQLGFDINPILLTMKKDPTDFSVFLWLKAGAGDKLWRYRSFSHKAKNVTSFIFYLKIIGSANKPQLWNEYKKFHLKDDSLPVFYTARKSVVSYQHQNISK